ncbi:MAG TPA: hypothetical protein VIN11_00665 [Roseivirga sp.]
MKYKPTQEEMIAYLYGELPQEMMDKIEDYLNTHPEAKRELASLQDTRILMGDFEDEEMPQPLAFFNPTKNEEWIYWRKYVAIAATLLLVISFGWISGFKIDQTADGLHLGFGETNYGLNEEQVAEMIYRDRVALLDYVNTTLEVRNDSIEERFNIIQASLSNDDLIKQTFETEKETLLQDLSDLTEKLGDDYRDILRQIVVNFSNNIESQRIDDLRNIQAAFDALEGATIDRQLNMEDALFNLSERVNAIAANLSNNK